MLTALPSRAALLLALAACAAHTTAAPADSAPAPIPDASPSEAPPMKSVELSEFVDAGMFTITPLAGAIASPVSGEATAWFDVAIGTANDVNGQLEWSMRQRGPSAEHDVVFDTAHGRLTVSFRKLRPHLAPSWSKTFAALNDVPAAPAWLRPRLADAFGEGPVTVAEYSLRAGRSYFARVRTDSYALPPRREGAEPSRGSNMVLLVAEAAWEGAAPATKLVPAFLSWSY